MDKPVKNRQGRQSLAPGWQSLRHYQLGWLRQDGLAGLTVAAYLIPQCMAYGELAGVQPVAGLWAILPPMLIYALLGSSPQLSVGPESTTAVMTAVAIAPLAMTNTSTYASIAAFLAILVGLVYLVGYIAHLGFLADLLSKPILVGYMAGVAIIMITGQLSKVSGIPIQANSIWEQTYRFVSDIEQIHWKTFLIASLVLVFLWSSQRRFPRAPGPLIAVLLATTAVALFHLDQQGVKVVGMIPAGLPHLQLPQPSVPDLSSLVAAAMGIAVVGYSDNILTARAFANRHSYQIDGNQELLALGIANLGTGVLQGFPISSSGSRTVIGDALGSKTQVFSLVAWGAVMGVLLFLRPLLALFPTAALGAIVIFAATKLIDISEFYRLWQFRKTEFGLAVITSLGVLGTDILIGVALAVALSVIDLFTRIARPHDAVLGKVPGLAGWHDIADWQGAATWPGLVIYRYDAPLCFANAENFKQRVLEAITAEADPVRWLILNTEAIIDIDITAVDMLESLRQELSTMGITCGLARVKQDLYNQLKPSEFLQHIPPDYIFPSLQLAVTAFVKDVLNGNDPMLELPLPQSSSINQE
ncbi:MAG: solute carrier 26 family protein [Acaryochloridaceae cyanobacterium SU_2_1]|nr:solute carrier 26 family protein [Acaryochloridaceae cyanobacterium SU_2_1]NJM95605.1 solute carrier 26 family protein [Acaryochloridaceae cyanobacterium CSU_5_19]